MKLAPIPLLAVAAAIALTFTFASRASCDWPPGGVALCASGVCQATAPVPCPDGQGGAFIVWADYRNDVLSNGNDDLYVQHITASGAIAPGWPADGVPVCTNPAAQLRGASVPDGLGGVLITWFDYRVPGTDIYAQRVLADGTIAPSWPVDGAPVSQASGTQDFPTVAPDGQGGAYFTWDDENVRDIYAQHLTATGQVAPGWPANGLPVCTLPGVQGSPQLIPDGSGGTLLAWGDLRSGAFQMYADRLLADGSLSAGWIPSGTLVLQGRAPRDMATDGSGGAYLACAVPGSIQDASFYVQHFTGGGTLAPGWPLDGIPVCLQPANMAGLRVGPDGQGGALLAWSDDRFYAFGADEVFVHRFRPDGTRAPGFPVDGLRVTTYSGFDDEVELAPDGLGGAYLCWSRLDDQYRIAAQRITGAGTVAPGWPANGLVIPGLGNHPRISEDGMGGAIVAWEAYDGSGTVRALRFNLDGPVPALVSLVSAEAERDVVRLSWYAADEPGLLATLARRTDQADWQSLALLRADGTGQLGYEDRDVVAGARYAYQLRYAGAAGEQTTGETWVTVPGFVFALQGLTPNPSEGAFKVAFSLPNGERALLEVYDVAGRRMLAREVGSLGVGQHHLDLSQEAHLPAGVYQLCLTQGMERAVRRAVVLR